MDYIAREICGYIRVEVLFYMVFLVMDVQDLKALSTAGWLKRPTLPVLFELEIMKYL